MKRNFNIAMMFIAVIMGATYSSCSKSDDVPEPKKESSLPQKENSDTKEDGSSKVPTLYCGDWECISSVDTLAGGQIQKDLLKGDSITFKADGTYFSTSFAAGCEGLYATQINKISVTPGDTTFALSMTVTPNDAAIIATCTFSENYSTLTWIGKTADKAFRYVFHTHVIDLGLPSGTKWADMNVGAAKPEDNGWYLAWGETEEKSSYDWSTYKWCNGSEYDLTKYCTNSSRGTVDNKVVLDSIDDAATKNWGKVWRMPTKTEMAELRSKCTWTWATQSNVKGYMVTGLNGNSIFLPAAGYRDGNTLVENKTDPYGSYWSSSLYETLENSYAWDVYFISSEFNRSIYGRRSLGRNVRPVTSI